MHFVRYLLIVMLMGCSAALTPTSRVDFLSEFKNLDEFQEFFDSISQEERDAVCLETLNALAELREIQWSQSAGVGIGELVVSSALTLPVYWWLCVQSSLNDKPYRTILAFLWLVVTFKPLKNTIMAFFEPRRNADFTGELVQKFKELYRALGCRTDIGPTGLIGYQS